MHGVKEQGPNINVKTHTIMCTLSRVINIKSDPCDLKCLLQETFNHSQSQMLAAFCVNLFLILY